MVLLIIIPMKNGYFIGGIPHFQTYPNDCGRHNVAAPFNDEFAISWGSCDHLTWFNSDLTYLWPEWKFWLNSHVSNWVRNLRVGFSCIQPTHFAHSLWTPHSFGTPRFVDELTITKNWQVHGFSMGMRRFQVCEIHWNTLKYIEIHWNSSKSRKTCGFFHVFPEMFGMFSQKPQVRMPTTLPTTGILRFPRMLRSSAVWGWR